MRVRLPRAVVVALLAVLAVGCGAPVTGVLAASFAGSQLSVFGHCTVGAVGKPSFRWEAEAFRPILALRTHPYGNRGGFLSR
jgi:hypothetical protein